MQAVGTGFETVDAALGGLITGDNVVWICDDEATYQAIVDGFVTAATNDGQRTLHIDFGAGVGPGVAEVDRVDAGPATPLGGPSALLSAIDRRVKTQRTNCLVVGDLARPMRRWGAETTMEFFAQLCPSMLQAGVTAYWSLGPTFGRPALDTVRQITQCLVDVRGGRLRVLKAEGRAASQQAVSYRLNITDGDVVATLAPAGGRLARGLVALRGELGLTQQELATVGGVTPSAISQAESGARGLSLDTLVRISDQLAVPLDRLVNAVPAPAYHLARHDRARRVGEDTIGLVTDSAIGARVYLVEVPSGALQTPVIEHHGVQVIACVRGLVQIDLGDDRPVLRAGDTLVIDTAPVRSWRNLRRQPAQFFRILRD